MSGYLCSRFVFRAVRAVLLVMAAPVPFVLGQGDDPFATPSRPASKRATTTTEVKPKVQKDDVAVQILRDSNPSSPEQMTRAVKIFLDFGRFDDAKEYIGRIMSAGLDDAALTQLNLKFGSDFFIRLQQAADLQPEGQQFSQAVLNASATMVRDPQRIESLIMQLSDPDLKTRAVAANHLKLAGRYAVGPLVRVLADPARSGEHPIVRNTLARFEISATEPLIGTLESTDADLRTQIIQVLGRIGAIRTTPYLVRAALSADSTEEERAAAQRIVTGLAGGTPTVRDATQYLTRRVNSLLAGEIPVALDEEDRGELWHWNAETKMPEPRKYESFELSLMEASRIARELYLLAPQKTEHRDWYLATLLESAKVAFGLDNPLPRGDGTAHSAATAIGGEALEELLSFCLHHKRTLAAVAVAEVLGDAGSPGLLISSSGQPRVLAACLGNPDRRLRFAAAEAILKIDPREPFAGASLLTDTLGFATASVGAHRVLAAHPRISEAQTLVGMMNERGFHGDAASSGRNVFRLAVQYPDYEFALISQVIDGPRASDLLQMLRQDPRTAQLVVGLMTRTDDLEKVRNLMEGDHFTVVITQPYDDVSLDLATQILLNRARRHLVPRDERLRQAEVSLAWIGRLLENPSVYSFYEVRRLQPAVETAIQTPELASSALSVLGRLGSPNAQKLLVDFASQSGQPLNFRRDAANAFLQAVTEHSLLLTREGILTQYDRYNNSETSDPETQQVLSAILDVIESKTEPSSNQPAESSPGTTP